MENMPVRRRLASNDVRLCARTLFDPKESLCLVAPLYEVASRKRVSSTQRTPGRLMSMNQESPSSRRLISRFNEADSQFLVHSVDFLAQLVSPIVLSSKVHSPTKLPGQDVRLIDLANESISRSGITIKRRKICSSRCPLLRSNFMSERLQTVEEDRTWYSHTQEK